MTFTDFKNIIGENGDEIAEKSGYTRQGLYNAFDNIDNGHSPSKKFMVCINSVIEKKIDEEIEKHEKRMQELLELQEQINSTREVAC